MNSKRSVSETINRARSLRRDQTDAEKLVWHKIRDSQLGVRFRRQAPIGPYFAEFLALDLKLIVEIDGGQHADNAGDMTRTNYLEGLGFTVARFWNSDVMSSIDGVVQRIEEAIASRRAGNAP
jgi:very-short-patch-repair endonuclease